MALLHIESLPPRATKGELLQFLQSNGGIDPAKVGRIDLRGRSAVVEVPDSWEVRLVKALDGAALRDRRLRVSSSAGSTPSSGPEDHFDRLAHLLTLESEAQAQQMLENIRQFSSAGGQRSGDCLTELVITEEHSGLGGRCILTLAKRNRTLDLPWNRLEPGTPVILSLEKDRQGEGCRGVVCERQPAFLCVALNDPPEEAERGTTYRIDLAGDEIAHQRQVAALKRAQKAERDRLAELRQTLLGETPPTFLSEVSYTPLDANLDASQQEAVRFALAARDVAVIHGPPGTGKTTTVIEVIRQAVRAGHRVLACAPSNLAVDNLLERLLALDEQVVRIGHPARVLPALRAHTLDSMVEDHDDTRLARKLAKEAFALFRKAGKFTRARPEPGARQSLRREAREMLADARKLEAQAVDAILDRTPIVCATLTSLDSEVLGQRQFDLAMIDEASQTTEPACWLALLRCQRLVLAGDHCQLPPTVVSAEAVRRGFGISLLERLVDLFGSAITRRLEVQYRMHEAIMTFSSQQFYDAALQAHRSVAGHLLQDLPGVAANAMTQTPVQFIDTAGAGYSEEEEPGGASRLNTQEAELIRRHVQALIECGLPAKAIAVIAPYAAQVRLLRDRLSIASLEIDSIDGFQGREKEAVLLSLVRSNTLGEVGFLADIRRMNVALTRARRKLVVVGDSATLSAHPFYQAMVAHFESIGAYRSVWEEDQLP